MKVVIEKYCSKCQQRYTENYYVCMFCHIVLSIIVKKVKEEENGKQ